MNKTNKKKFNDYQSSFTEEKDIKPSFFLSPQNLIYKHHTSCDLRSWSAEDHYDQNWWIDLYVIIINGIKKKNKKNEEPQKKPHKISQP